MKGGTRMRAISVFRAAMLCLLASASVAIAQTTSTQPASGSGMISILDAAPSTYYGMMRYPKFYGDANMDRATIDGSVLHRQYLLGSLGGTRDKLAKNGLVVNAAVTQAIQGAASGDGDGATYFGSGDLWMAFDTGRARLWPGGLVYAHFEGNWGQQVAGTGALLPINGDTIMPAPPSRAALSELYLFQGLPDDFAVVAGKVDWAAFADTSPFANNERTQFMYEGLINNPLLGSFVPYTSLGGMLLKQVNAELGGGIVVTSNNTNATSAGFNKVNAQTMTYGVAANWTPKFGGRPGVYSVLVGYTTKDATNFDVDERYLTKEIIGQVPVAQKGGNYAATLTASQYLWVDPNARRSDGLPVGIGPFFRFGIAPSDRNLLDRFYSVGVGGNGGLFGRINDNWGIGWAGTHFSGDFRRDAAALGIGLDSFENAVEAFYNFALTPAVGLSVDLQSIDSAVPGKKSLVIGTRLQVDL